MPRAALTVAEVFRRYGDTFRAEVGAALSTAHSRVMTAIEQCRTAALGGHVEQCDHCGHRRVWYNSCRNRHCPTCQSLARATWLERRRADLLPTEYFHVVFTVPPAIAEVAAQNKAVVYGLLFRAVAETLRTIAADPRHLGAEIGFFAVLHTWGQTLVHHPHLHCVIPGGGLASDGSGWVACRPGFFLPVRVLSRYFRRVLLAALEDAFESGQLHFAGRLQSLSDPRHFAEHLRPARETEWVVYAKRPFAPQWTGQNRPFMDTSKPAISGGPRLELRSTSRRPLLATCFAGALAVTPEASGQLDSLQYRQIQIADLLEQRRGRGPGKRFRQRVAPLPVLFLQLQERLHGVVPLLWPRSPVRWPTVPDPGFAGLAPLPVTCLPLRVRQRHNDHAAPLRNGARGKRSAKRSRRKRGDRPTARLSSVSVYACGLVRDSVREAMLRA